jgi:hypothetical protein
MSSLEIAGTGIAASRLESRRPPGCSERRCAPALQGALFGVLLWAFLGTPLQAAKVLIVLDASGSMRAAAGGTSKMDAAKRAVRTTVEAIDSSSVVGLRLYGHRLPSEPKEASCADTELVIPFGPLDRARYVAAVEAAKPLGQTPLAHSLEQAVSDFGALGDEAAAVILVSDGEESCGGDPAAVACAFAERGIDLTVHTVGFDVDAAARAQLQAIAQCTGGEYRDARDAGQLAESLRQLTQAGLLLDKQLDLAGAIRGGNGYPSAVPITPGTYHLDHHQRQDEHDYFTIDVEPGHTLRVSQTSHQTGVVIDGGVFTEGGGTFNLSGAGVHIHGPDRSGRSSDEVTSAGETATASVGVTAGEGGRYYVLIGSSGDVWSHANGGNIHLASPITVELIDQTDAGSGTDAGATDREAVSLAPGEHRAWLQTNADVDVFALAARPGASYTLRVRPDQREARLSATLADEDGVELAKADSPNDGAAVRLEAVGADRAGLLYLTVATANNSSYTRIPTAYALELTADAGAEPAETSRSDAAEDVDGTQDDEDASSPSGRGRLGGALGCVVLPAFLLLGVGALAVVVVVVLKRRKG